MIRQPNNVYTPPQAQEQRTLHKGRVGRRAGDTTAKYTDSPCTLRHYIVVYKPKTAHIKKKLFELYKKINGLKALKKVMTTQLRLSNNSNCVAITTIAIGSYLHYTL